MKSLQNKLNLIKEGKGNKELFLKEARAMFPNIVTGALTFDQAIHNLTERGILSEGFVGIGNQSIEQPNWFKIFDTNLKEAIKEETYALSNQEIKEKSPITNMSIIDMYNLLSEIDNIDFIQEIGIIISRKDWNNRGEFAAKQKIYREIQKRIDDQNIVDDLEEEIYRLMKASSKKLNEAIGVKNTKEYGDQNEFEKIDKETEETLKKANYNNADPKNINNLYGQSFLLGFMTEMHDPKNAEKTEEELKKIVVKNLKKDPMHYVKDGQFGVKGLGYTNKHPGLGHTKEVTGKYKSSGMEPVKLNESKHSAEADLKIHKSELNMLNKIKPTGEKQLKRKAELEKKIADLEKKMTEVFYGSSDGDFDANQEDIQMAYSYYDKGLEAYSEGDFLKADRYYTAALKYGSYVGFTGADLPPYGTEHLEEASNLTSNELASYIGILQNEIDAEKDPKKLKMLKQDLEDTKQELAKRREAKKTKNGMSEYLGGRLEVPRNYGMDFDDEEDDYEDEDEEYYDEEGNVVPLRSPLHPRNRNMGEGNKKLKESYGMSLKDAMREAYKESLNGYVQHVEDTGDGVFFEVSDWYDSEATVVSFEDGRKFNDKTSEYIMNEADSIKKRRAILRSKQEGIADEIPVVSMLSKVIQQVWAEPDLNKAKEMVLTHIQQSRIHPRSKKTMSYNIETAQTKPRLDQYLANALLSYEKMSVTEGANKVMEKAIKEIEKKSELAKAEAKLHQVEELISELENKLTMTEADGMSDMVDKKKVKEIKRNLKFLENKKKRYLSEKAKLDKKYGVKTMIEEEKVDPTIEDEKMASKAMQSMRRDVAQPARAWSEIVKGILASKGVKK